MEQPSVKAFVDYWRNVRGRTRRVVMCIPPDQMEWAPADGRWTLGDTVRHLAGIERYMYAETARQRPAAYTSHGRELAEGFDAVVAYHDRLHEESCAIFESLTDADMAAKCETPGGVRLTTWKWLRAMVEHEAHHRGQLYLMLGQLGVKTPPIFGLSEEELVTRVRTTPVASAR